MRTPTLQNRRRQINKEDPRVRRTLKLLGTTLMDLITEKGYESVTIQDITDRAEVSRTTFYLHFRDKDELLFENMREMYEDLAKVARHVDYSDPAAAEAAMCDPSDFEHVEKYLNFYKVMLSEKGSMTFVVRVLDYLTMMFQNMLSEDLPVTTNPRIPLPVIAASLAGSEIALVRWWIVHDRPFTPAEMAKFLFQAQVNGLWWALGIEDLVK